MRFLLSFALLLGLALTASSRGQESTPLKIGIIGDSTVCDYPLTAPRRGWGQLLPAFFKPQTSFLNLAESGRSTKTFPKDRWQQILQFKPDYILIQFGHNDSHPKTHPEATDAATDFTSNLRRFITEGRQAGAIPILVTPMHRRTFDPSHHVTRELEPYALAMKELAHEMNVPLVDLYLQSGLLFDSLGEKASTPLTINDTDHNDRPGSFDRTHFTPQGAREMARLVASTLAGIDPRLHAALLNPNPSTH